MHPGGIAVLRHAFLLGDHDMQRLRQLTFASLECDRKKRREIFLERMDGLIPWARLEARIAPTPKGKVRARVEHPFRIASGCSDTT